MASNYMTSDGVDLDSRYLGINAKAKSAATADTATKANSVDWGGVSGKPSNLSYGGYKTTAVISGGVTGSGNKATYKVPKNCVAKVTVSSRDQYADDYMNFSVSGGYTATREGNFKDGYVLPDELFLPANTTVTVTLSRTAAPILNLAMRQYVVA